MSVILVSSITVDRFVSEPPGTLVLNAIGSENKVIKD